MDEFEAMYEDELDAMDEFDEPDFPPSKKSLSFQTPRSQKNCSKITDLDGSLLTPLDSPSDKDNATEKEAVSRKKKRDESVFGSLSDNDLDFEDELPDIAPQRKRQKKSQEANITSATKDLDDFEITPPPSPDIAQKIVSHRERQTYQGVSLLETNRDMLHDRYDYERPRVLRRMPAGDFIAATAEDGTRVYMTVKDEEDWLKEQRDSVNTGAQMTNLLGMPFSVLKNQVDLERQKRVMEESARITAQLNRQIDLDLGLDPEDSQDGFEQENHFEVQHSHLWVEQYKPRFYTDLLSDEGTNRTLLHWLKQWDYVVFGKEKKTKVKTKEQIKKEEMKKKFKNSKWNQPEVNEELDQHNRPFHKVALLCGAPGLGKTTLAHVIARHAGYNVIEMNASDDRQADVFKTKVESATQMKAVLGADPRPNCLIIDEIDGAPQPAINMLINLVKRTGNETTGKKKKKEGGILLRPIICICNDQYVPSLRQLRQNALVLNFPETVASRLASRLLEIARVEHMRAEMTALLQLCEKTNNDIRSCLNTLQFAQRKSKELTLSTVQSMGIGQKDNHKTLFSVWQEIFKMPKPKKKRFINPHDRVQGQDLSDMIGQNNMSMAARFQNTLNTAIAAGDHEKVLQGLFENYLEVKFKDPRFDGVNLATDWMCFNDFLSKEIAHSQNYIFMKYMPYLAVVFHLLFASNTQNKLSYPHSYFEYKSKLERSKSLVQTMMSDVSASVRRNLNVPITTMEVMPPLMEIIQPSLRPVNTQLYSAREKDDLANLIKIMIAYNMTYHQERAADGQYNYILEPNVDEVVRYSGMKQKRQLTYAAKQLIAREIDMEKMRRSEPLQETATPSLSQKTGLTPVVPNHLQKLEPKPFKLVEDKPATDFFGRVIKKKTPEPKKDAEEKKKNVLKTDIWFRFKEGFSNAVRRQVKIQDFL